MDFTAGIFEHDVVFDETARVAARQAVAVAHKRAQDLFGSFLAQATEADLHQRFALVEDELSEIIHTAAEEYGGDPDQIESAILISLAAGGFCDDCRKWKSGPKAGCTCGDTRDKKEDDEESAVSEADNDSSVESSVKTARWTVIAEDLETVDLPTGDDTALDGPSPKMDKSEWKPNALNDEGNLSPIDTEGAGSPHPTVQQDITAVADHTKDPLEQTRAVTETEDVGKERSIERIHTDTWNGTDNQATPVTSSVDVDRNPIRDLMEQGIVPQAQLDAAVAAYEARS